MDPAFATNEETVISYPLQDFTEAWGRRGFISYIFEKRIIIFNLINNKFNYNI
jgi:hypothetical protein